MQGELWEGKRPRIVVCYVVPRGPAMGRTLPPLLTSLRTCHVAKASPKREDTRLSQIKRLSSYPRNHDRCRLLVYPIAQYVRVRMFDLEEKRELYVPPYAPHPNRAINQRTHTR